MPDCTRSLPLTPPDWWAAPRTSDLSATGMVKVIRVPPSSPSLSAQIRPPCASTIPLQTASPSHASSCFPPPPGELLEQGGQILGRNPFALVCHGDRHVEVPYRRCHPDGGRPGRVPGSIGKELVHHLQDTLFPRPCPGQVRWQIDLDAVCRTTPQERGPRVLDQGRHVHGLGRERQRSGLDLCHVEKVVDQAAQKVRLTVDDPESWRVSAGSG